MQLLQDQLHSILPDAAIKVATLPKCQGLRLYLLDENYPIGALDNATAQRIMNNPLYWLFFGRVVWLWRSR